VSRPPAPSDGPPFRYRLFISYSHRDRKWARWLHRALESYRVPVELKEKVELAGGRWDRISPVFRDREELPTGASLSDAVNSALEQSENLVVICSPASARSRWVNEEILTFKRLGRSDRIFCFIVDGEPGSGGDTECYAPALRHQWIDGELSTVPVEPLGADARRVGDGRTLAKLKLVAGIQQVELDDLRRRELIRRNRRLVWIAAGSLAIASVTVGLAILAYLSNAEAERRRAQAEDLIGFMVGDLYERLHEIGRLDVFMSVGNKAMDYFGKLSDEDVDDTVLNQRAEALTQIGNTRLDQGETDLALASFEEAYTITKRLAESDPSRPDWQIALANSHFWLGFVHWENGDLDAAGAEFGKVIPLVDGVAEADPDNPEWLIEQSYAYTNFARVLELQGELETALDQYREIARINERLLSVEPDNTDYRLEVGFAHNNIGKVVQSLGRLEEAEQHFGTDLEIKSKISASDPANNLWRFYFATSHAFAGRNARARGDLEAARDHYTEAMGIMNELAGVDPASTSYADHLAKYDWEFSAVALEQGALAEARDALDESSAIWARLLESDADRWDWLIGQGMTDIFLCELALMEHNPAEAVELSSRALQRFESLNEQQPDNQDTRHALVLAGLVAGDARAKEDAAAAESYWTKALTDLEDIQPVGVNPELTELKAALLLRLGREEEARPLLQQIEAMGYYPRFITRDLDPAAQRH